MTKAIKEVIIMLLICLILMLILAIVLYDYIPNKKIVAEVETYATSEEIKTQLSDDIDSEEKGVVLTYEVTSKELNSYESKNEYVPGKANPFAEVSKSIDENVVNNSIEDPGSSHNNTTVTNSFGDDNGIK